MSLIQLIVLAVIAAIAGTIGQTLAGYHIGGCLVSAFVGYIGGLIGVWLARQLHLPELLTVQIGGEAFPIVWAIIGSAIFAFAVGFFTRQGGWSRRRVL